MDSQTEAREEKGRHETQVSEGGEANLYNHFMQCTKNPGHEEFIPVNIFSPNHLPEGYRYDDLYKLVKTLAELTVRIGIDMTSPHRPEFSPGKNEPFPFYEMRGSRALCTGTGRVFALTRYKNGADDCGTKHFKRYISCWCTDCKDSLFPNKEWWEIQVLTANHVVFDDVEASNASVRFFFDSENCSKLSLEGATVVSADVQADRRVMKVVTCDVELGQKRKVGLFQD